MNLRVLHINTGNLYGGVEVFLATLARHAAVTPEVETEFAVCFPGKHQDELRELKAVVHALRPVRVRYPWTVGLARRDLAALLQRFRYDVVVCHAAWVQAIFGPVVRRRTASRQVFWLHDPPGEKLHWLERWARQTPPDFVICNSAYTRVGANGHHRAEQEFDQGLMAERTREVYGEVIKSRERTARMTRLLPS